MLINSRKKISYAQDKTKEGYKVQNWNKNATFKFELKMKTKSSLKTNLNCISALNYFYIW